MESLSRMRTIMAIVQDILAAVETASQNKSRCNKVAKRVRCIKDILEAAAPAQDGTPATDAATRRLKKALRRALQVVRQCQRSSSILASVAVFFAGWPKMAESLDEVEREIDRCILDLTLAISLIRQQHTVAAASSTEDSSISEKDDKNKGRSAERSVVLADKTTETAAAIGVPVCTVTSAAVVHEMVPPPPSYGYCYGYGCCCSRCRSYHSYYWRNHGCQDGDAGGPSNAAALYRTQYSSYYPSMFSDDDPNPCSIM